MPPKKRNKTNSKSSAIRQGNRQEEPLREGQQPPLPPLPQGDTSRKASDNDSFRGSQGSHKSRSSSLPPFEDASDVERPIQQTPFVRKTANSSSDKEQVKAPASLIGAVDPLPDLIRFAREVGKQIGREVRAEMRENAKHWTLEQHSYLEAHRYEQHQQNKKWEESQHTLIQKLESSQHELMSNTTNHLMSVIKPMLIDTHKLIVDNQAAFTTMTKEIQRLACLVEGKPTPQGLAHAPQRGHQNKQQQPQYSQVNILPRPDHNNNYIDRPGYNKIMLGGKGLTDRYGVQCQVKAGQDSSHRCQASV